MTGHDTLLLLAAKQISEPLSAEEQADLEAHVAACPTCRSMAAGMRRDDARLRAELGAANVSTRVRRRVLDEATGNRYIEPRLILGLAAALLVAAIGVPLMAGARLVADPSPSVATPAPPTPSPSRPQSNGSPSAATPDFSPSATGSGAFVAGAYTYGEFPPRRDSVAAHFEGGEAVGEWSRTIPATDGESYGGPVTCLVISGSDAWLAGPATTATDGSTDRAALVYLHDGGFDGSGDKAILWLTNPGQTLATVTTWCEDRFVPAPPVDLSSGDLVVEDAP